MPSHKDFMATMKKPLVIVTRRLPERVEERMSELFDVRLNENDHPFTVAQLKKAVAEADVLVPTVTDKITAEVIGAAGPSLKLIANFGAGVDHIDLAAAQTKNLLVTNTPSVLTEDTADIAMGLILAAPRRLSEAASIMRRGEWTGWTPTFLLGHRVNGKKLGFVGLGRIGQAVARRAKGFGMELHYYKRKRLHPMVEDELGIRYWPELDEMLGFVDMVTVHCPYTPETHHLLDARRLGLMKPESYLINTARGSVVDEAALTTALAERRIAGAGLDVYEREPHVSPELLKLHNVVLLPHVSSATIEGREEMGMKVVVNIKSYVDGHKPPDRLLFTNAV